MINIFVIAAGGVAVVKQNQILISAPTAVQSYVEVNDMKHYSTVREVIFRGKRTDNGEWITDSETYIRDGDGIWLSDENLNVVTVIPETVGQFTGLTDKNGRRIFEGDIVDYISSDVIGNPKTGTIIVEDMTDYDTMIYLNHSEELQIIGNIHDNPDILKGGGENG